MYGQLSKVLTSLIPSIGSDKYACIFEISHSLMFSLYDPVQFGLKKLALLQLACFSF